MKNVLFGIIRETKERQHHTNVAAVKAAIITVMGLQEYTIDHLLKLVYVVEQIKAHSTDDIAQAIFEMANERESVR